MKGGGRERTCYGLRGETGPPETIKGVRVCVRLSGEGRGEDWAFRLCS